jgi:hypothetical protein
MITNDIIYTIVRTFPESLLIILAGLSLLGIKKDKIYVLKQGILLGIIVSIIRRLPINLGTHTILSMIAVGVILFNICKEKLINSIIATCQIWIALALSEGIYMLIAMQVFKIAFEDLVRNTGIYGAIITLPSLVIFGGVVLLFNKIQNRIKRNYI